MARTACYKSLSPLQAIQLLVVARLRLDCLDLEMPLQSFSRQARINAAMARQVLSIVVHLEEGNTGQLTEMRQLVNRKWNLSM